MPRTMRLVPKTEPAPLTEADLQDIHWELRMKAAFLEATGKTAEGAKRRSLAQRVLTAQPQPNSASTPLKLRSVTAAQRVTAGGGRMSASRWAIHWFPRRSAADYLPRMMLANWSPWSTRWAALLPSSPR